MQNSETSIFGSYSLNFFYISYVFVIKKLSRCLQKLQDNKNLEHKENIPEIHIVFSLHLQKKIKAGSKMDLLSISKCAARAFNRSKYCRKLSKNVWIYMSFTTILNIIKTSPKYIYFFTSFAKKIKSGWKWICYQSLNVQQEPITDQILKKINTG